MVGSGPDPETEALNKKTVKQLRAVATAMKIKGRSKAAEEGRSDRAASQKRRCAVLSPTAYILTLARSFPCLAVKLQGWNPSQLMQTGSRYDWSMVERRAALRAVHTQRLESGYADMQGWRFDLFEFISCADSDNRQALIDWIEHPQWP